jgi:hypothetical protein
VDRSSTTNDDDGTIVGQTGEEREHMNRAHRQYELAI